MAITNILRTATFRITAYYVLVFIGSLLALAALFYFVAAEFWEAEVREIVTAERERLIQTYEDTGIAGLQQLIERDAEPVRDEGFIYLLEGLDGTKLAGQLPVMPIVEGWQDVVPPWGEEEEPFVAIGTILSDRWYLLVGRDAHDLQEALEFVEEGLLPIIVVALALSLVGGLIVSGLILRRLEAVNRATVEIRRGSLEKRIPQSGSNDEFDQLATHLNSMLDGIQDLTEGIRQVSNDIAHDLRTPLTRVRNMVESARATPPSQADVPELLDAILFELDRLLEAFAAMLRIAHMDAGTLRSSFASFDLSQALSDLAQDFEPLAGDAGMKLEASIEPGVQFFGERRLVVQMMVNLIENAITHSGGEEIALSLRRQGDTIEIKLCDDGVGIPASEHEKVFQRFHRLDKSRHTAGFGLGLSLVGAIAKLHGIDVSLVDNRPGLCVVLSIPGNG